MHPKTQHGPLVLTQDQDETATHRNLGPMAFESSGSETASSSISDIIEGLPTAVKSSLGPLRTIKRSVGILGWASYFYEISSNSTSTTSSHDTDAHHTTVVSGTSATAVEMQQSTQSQARAQGQQPMTGLVNEEAEQNVGIDRVCGLQGQLLVSNALAGDRFPTAQGRPGSDKTDRKAYVQGVAWLIHGLPEDLDQHERTELLRSMPLALLEGAYDDSNSRSSSHPLSPHHRRLSSLSTSSSSDHRTLVHRAVQAFVAQLIIPLQILWAYFILLLGQAVQLERKYKVMEQVVKHSGELGYTVGKRGVRLSETIISNGGARVGQLVTGAVTYTAEGLVKGISDGIKEARTERRQVGDS